MFDDQAAQEDVNAESVMHVEINEQTLPETLQEIQETLETVLKDVRAAGYSEGEIVEIVANVTANIFTNYFNHVAGTDIDFPVVTTQKAAA